MAYPEARYENITEDTRVPLAVDEIVKEREKEKEGIKYWAKHLEIYILEEHDPASVQSP